VEIHLNILIGEEESLADRAHEPVARIHHVHNLKPKGLSRGRVEHFEADVLEPLVLVKAGLLDHAFRDIEAVVVIIGQLEVDLIVVGYLNVVLDVVGQLIVRAEEVDIAPVDTDLLEWISLLVLSRKKR
jgi:hypothetical protein